MDYWEKKLRAEAVALPSLACFDPRYMSLAKPHPIWWTAGSNPYEVAKALIQCRMLSGRYRTCQLTSHWSDDQTGECPALICQSNCETVEHILLHCPAYSLTRLNLVEKFKSIDNPPVHALVTFALTKPNSYMLQFLLDASVLPETRSLIQSAGDSILYQIFSLTRS